ncbi:MAG TPA: glycosyltransferase family A protein [Cyclobacteriaceae bacterium]|nr:glycosyltransferase family A protein [Cyclobacteriaceae bacterium]
MSMTTPGLSILIPAYNAGPFIGSTLRSLLLQTYTDFEILVCDDGSTDNTADVVRTFTDPRIRFFQNKENRGKNFTGNFLLDQAAGKWANVHDADDISVPSRLENQMNFLNAHPQCVLCGTNFIAFVGNGKVIEKSNLETESKAIREKIKTVSQFHGPTVIFRKDIALQVGGLYRFFDHPSDIDFTMRVAERFETANLKEYLYYYRHQPGSLSNDVGGYDLKRLADVKMLYHLARERAENQGIDTLMRGDDAKIRSLMEEFTAEYRADPSIALRRGVFRLLGMKMYSNAMRLSIKALRASLNELNLKCVVYAFLYSIKGSLELLLSREKIDLRFLK